LVENLNSRLRNYFFLRRNLGQGYLDLLLFFLNHRVFMRSERPERIGKSPTELMTGKPHPHWLELLGFELFRQPPVSAEIFRLFRQTVTPMKMRAGLLFSLLPKIRLF